MLKKCVKCGYVRQALDEAPISECPKCGVIYAKAEAALAAKNLKLAAQSVGSDGHAESNSTPPPYTGSKRKLVLLLLGIAILIGAGFELYKYLQEVRAAQQQAERRVGFDKLTGMEKRWQDGYKLAASTSRIALSGPVQNLQTIGRELRDIQVSQCLLPAQALLVEAVDLTADAFMEFMKQSEFTSNLRSLEAAKKFEAYKSEKAKCS